MSNLRRTPCPDGNDYIILAADDYRLVRHGSYETALDAAQALSYKHVGKSFRIFVALSDVTTREVAHTPNTTYFFATPHDTLLVAAQTDGEGHIRRVIVGTSDGTAFSASPEWLAKRDDLRPVPDCTEGQYVTHLIGMLELITRIQREAELLAKGAAA